MHSEEMHSRQEMCVIGGARLARGACYKEAHQDTEARLNVHSRSGGTHSHIRGIFLKHFRDGLDIIGRCDCPCRHTRKCL